MACKATRLFLIGTTCLKGWLLLAYVLPMPPSKVVEPHEFLPANQQRSGYVTSMVIMASDQLVVTWNTGFGPALLQHLWSQHTDVLPVAVDKGLTGSEVSLV